MAGDDSRAGGTEASDQALLDTVLTPDVAAEESDADLYATPATVDGVDSLLAQVAATPTSGVPSGALARGEIVDRYVILDHLGAGGMGTVYKAYDPNLDRRVALKFLVDTRSRAGTRERLLREAQALAQLSHPNVVAVHDVGTVDDQVFVAMEFVEGTPLDAWIADDRDWRDILSVFTECGRGLAAAHVRGIVHRDFKPQNVMVGADGRARVLDFGLAHAEDSDPELGRSELERGGHELRDQLTMTGTLMGTPAYMAPEQFAGGRTDGRTDQFAFAVALYRSLYGRMPFDGATFEQLSRAVRHAEVREPPPGHGVPKHIFKVLLRALSKQPGDRFFDMTELLDALNFDPRTTRRRLLAGAGVVSLAGVAVLGLMRGGAAPDKLCKAAPDKLIGVWDDSIRDGIAATFSRLRPRTATTTFRLLSAKLSTYASAWVKMRTQACVASRVRGDESPVLMDRRMTCLDRRLGRMRALTRLLRTTADGSVVDRAVVAAADLPSLDRCADSRALLAAIPPPEDERTRNAVAGLRRRLDDVQALSNTGQYVKALPLASAIADEARTTGYAPFIASALHAHAQLLITAHRAELAETTQRAAIAAAGTARDHRRVAQGWVRMIGILGHQRSKHDAGLALEPVATTAIAQTGGDPSLVAELSDRVAIVLQARGDLDAALARSRAALDQYVRALGAGHRRVATMHFRISRVLRMQGKFSDATRHLRQSLRIRKTLLGDRHPRVADSYNGIGIVMNAQGDRKGAREHFSRALAIWRETHGERHLKIATALNNLGLVDWGAHSYASAVNHFTRSETIWSDAVGADHPNVGIPIANRASVLAKLGRFAEARKHFLRAKAHYSRVHDARHPKVGSVLFKLGYLALDERNYEEAVKQCVAALGLLTPKRGSRHPFVVYSRLCLGEGQLGRGKPTAAIQPFERGLAALEANKANPEEICEARFGLARALWAANRDRKRALALATKAEKAARAKRKGGDLHKKITAWLAKRQP